MKYIALFIMMLACSTAIAAGGKNRDQSPIISEDGCVYQTPPGLDVEKCELIPAPNQAGVVVYACDVQVIVFCSDDNEDE